MKIEFNPQALQELKTATDYYANISPRLEQRLLDCVESAVDQIYCHPLAWQQVKFNIRRKLVDQFPYELIYTLEQDLILILAVMHQHQKPNYWSERV